MGIYLCIILATWTAAVSGAVDSTGTGDGTGTPVVTADGKTGLVTVSGTADQVPAENEVKPTRRRLDPNWKPSEVEVQQFDQQNALLQQHQALAPVVTSPIGGTMPPISGVEERAAAFDKQFCSENGGCHKAAVDFKASCAADDACPNRKLLASGQLIMGGYQFLDLEKKAAANGWSHESRPYQEERRAVRREMRMVVEEIRPSEGASSSYTDRFIKVADPVIKQVFTPKEREQFAQVVAGGANNAPANTYLGDAYNDNGRPQEAVQAFDAALASDPRSNSALTGRARARFDLGDYPGAARDAQAALAIDPNDARAWATLKLSENRAPASGGSLAASAAGGGGSVQHGVSSAGSFSGPSAAPAAPESAETARRVQSLAAEARRSLGMQDASRAVGILDRAIAAAPGDPGTLLLRAMARARTGDFRGALADAEAGLRLRPRDAGLLVAKSYSLNRLKDYKNALDAARLAREADPSSADAIAQYAMAVGGLGRREEMLSLLAEAAAKDSRYTSSLASAQSLPAGSDLLFLFPGETMPASAMSAAPDSSGTMDPGRARRRLTWLAGATLLGGLIVAMLFLQGAAGAMTRKLKTMVLGAPAETETAAGPVPTLAASRALPEALRGQYRFERQIGSGGMGLVYRGIDLSLSRPVAIKKMREELRVDERERRRFLDEARTVAGLHHPNIVDIYAVIEEGPDAYLVFEYVDGETVWDILQKRGTLSLAQTLGISRGMAAALDYAHGQGVIHRDLKPSNVMVDKNGFIKVMDFGIARAAKDAATRVSMTNTIIGTPPYMAPEAERGEIRKEGDVFALAACAYELLTGKPAFSGAGMLMNKIDMAYVPPTKEVAALPPGTDEVIRKGLEADPAQRFHTAGEFLKALEGLSA